MKNNEEEAVHFKWRGNIFLFKCADPFLGEFNHGRVFWSNGWY